jgi:hypothetical protein
MEGFTLAASRIKESWEKNLREKHPNSLNEDTGPIYWLMWPLCLECNYHCTLMKRVRSERPPKLEARWKSMVWLPFSKTFKILFNPCCSKPNSFTDLLCSDEERQWQQKWKTSEKYDIQYTADLFGDRVFTCVPKVCEVFLVRKADTLPTAETLIVLEHLSHVNAPNSS